MTTTNRKEDRPAIYWEHPKLAPYPQVYLDGLWEDYTRRQRGSGEIRFRSDQARVLANVPGDGRWYECFLVMSEGEARSTRSGIANGEYGTHLACVFTYETNANNAADPQQRIHRMMVRRDPNS